MTDTEGWKSGCVALLKQNIAFQTAYFSRQILRVAIGGLNDQQHNGISRSTLCVSRIQIGVNGQVADCNQCAESLQRPDLVCWRSEHTQLVWAVAAVGLLISLCAVSTDTGLVGASRVTRLDCTDRCPKQQQPVAISAQPRSFRLPGFHNQIVVKSISIQ